MKTYLPSDIRNFAIVGHASAGKTMLGEAMLVCAGVIPRLGSIAAGNTVSDYHVSEKQRQISTQASLLHCEWQGRKFSVMDTPGYLDFISEALGPLRVGDFALVVIHAVHGFGIGTERVWDQGVRSFQCSRRADALKLWVALQRHGADGIGRLYDHLCDTTLA